MSNYKELEWGITVQWYFIRHALEYGNWYSTHDCPYADDLINWSCARSLMVLLYDSNISDITKRYYSEIWGHIDISKIDSSLFGSDLIQW